MSNSKGDRKFAASEQPKRITRSTVKKKSTRDDSDHSSSDSSGDNSSGGDDDDGSEDGDGDGDGDGYGASTGEEEEGESVGGEESGDEAGGSGAVVLPVWDAKYRENHGWTEDLEKESRLATKPHKTWPFRCKWMTQAREEGKFPT